jgi:outer membrane protein TolC
MSLSYLIYDFGTLRATSEASRQALYNADWTHSDAILVTLQGVMTSYYTYLYQQELLLAEEADIKTALLTLQVANVGFDAGVRDVSDVLQAKTQLLQYQTTWAAQQQNVENSYTALLTDVGLPASLRIAMQQMPKTPPRDDVTPPLETLIALSLQNRPDLLASEANYRSMTQSLRAAHRQFLPKFNYNFDIGKSYFNQGLQDKYNFTSTFSVTMPLFQGFFYRNAIKSAVANKNAAEEQMRQTQLNVIEEVTSYYTSVKVAFETLSFAQGFLAAAEEQYKVAIAEYKEGTNTILDVVSAQSSLADARAQVVNGFQQWYNSLANLAYATGLLSPTDLTPLTPTTEVRIAEERSETCPESIQR